MISIPLLRVSALSALILLAASCSDSNSVTDSDTSTIPTDVAAKLREIGDQNDLAGTAALYADDFSSDYLDELQVVRDQRYGPAERNVLDVMTERGLPPGRPVLIFVHGGGFGGGNKSAPNSPFYDNIPYWAAKQGLVGVNINYRYAPANQWPSGIEDLNQVVAWVKKNITLYGGDPEQIFFWGKSTGASHVSDYLADRVKRNLDPDVAGAIFTSGSYALLDEPTWPNYYGDDLSVYPERNGLPYMVQTSVPLMATYGEFDGAQYKQQFQLLLDAASEAGKEVEALHLLNHSHMSETYAVGTVDDSLTAPVLAFIRAHSK